MIIKVNPDREKVKSILRLAGDRENFVCTIDHEKFSTNAAEAYYEIIKELATGLVLLDGIKAVGDSAHKDLMEYLLNYKEFSMRDIDFMNDLRIKRNNSSYEGKKIEPIYLRNNTGRILEIIKRLKQVISKRLE